MTGRWVSRNALLWALYDAPDVPAHLLSTLIAVAIHTSQGGKGAYVSAATVAAITRKSERNAKKDLAELRKLGLLVPGNQRIAMHIRSDGRPMVYDLPMPRGVAGDTPSDGHGVSHTTGRGVAEGHHGVSQTTPKEIYKRSRIAGRGADGAPPPPGAHHETRPGPWMRCFVCDKPLAVDEMDTAANRRQLAIDGEVSHADCLERWTARNSSPPSAESIAKLRAQYSGKRQP